MIDEFPDHTCAVCHAPFADVAVWMFRSRQPGGQDTRDAALPYAAFVLYAHRPCLPGGRSFDFWDFMRLITKSGSEQELVMISKPQPLVTTSAA